MSAGCYPCCLCKRRKQTHPELVYHKFPKEKDRCLRWKEAANSLANTSRTTQDLHQHFRICSYHFSNKNYFNKRRLHSGACPDQNLEDNFTGTKNINYIEPSNSFHTNNKVLEDNLDQDVSGSLTSIEDIRSVQQFSSDSNLQIIVIIEWKEEEDCT